MESSDLTNAVVEKVCEIFVYHNYRFNRDTSPYITPDQWRAVYGDMVDELELRYLREKIGYKGGTA